MARLKTSSLPGENVPQQTGPRGTYLEMEGRRGYGNLEDRLIEEFIHKINWNPFTGEPTDHEGNRLYWDDKYYGAMGTSFKYGDDYRSPMRMTYDLEDLKREALKRDLEQFKERSRRDDYYYNMERALEERDVFNEMFPIEDRGWHNVAMSLGYEDGDDKYYKSPEAERTPFPTAEQFIEATAPESEWDPRFVAHDLKEYAMDYIGGPSLGTALQIARDADYTYDYDIKKPGIIAALQRLLPGGKSGRHQGQETLNLLGLASSRDYRPIIDEWYSSPGGMKSYYGDIPEVEDYSTRETRKNIGNVIMGTLEGLRGDEGNQISDIVKSLEAINAAGQLDEGQQERFIQIMGDI